MILSKRKFYILWTNIKEKILLRRIYRNKKLQFCYQLCRRQKQGRPGTWYVEGITKCFYLNLSIMRTKTSIYVARHAKNIQLTKPEKHPNNLNTLDIIISLRVFWRIKIFAFSNYIDFMSLGFVDIVIVCL